MLFPSPEECLGRSREGSHGWLGTPSAELGFSCQAAPTADISQCCQAINIEEFKRDGPYRTEFDGVLTGEPVLVDISKFHDGRVYSAKQLNMYMWCPYRYYSDLSSGYESRGRSGRGRSGEYREIRLECSTGSIRNGTHLTG